MYQVLVAEDEFWIRNQVIELVERNEGFKIIGEAQDGEEAWKLLNEHWPDILITDIMMPHMDGLALLKRIYEYNISVSPIIISGYDNFTYAQQAIRYGISEYLLKPLSEEKIKLALEQAVQHMERTHRHREYFLQIHAFTHKLDTLEQAGAWRELSELIKSILTIKTALANEKLGMLRILSDKLADQMRLKGESQEWGALALNVQDKEAVLKYFYGLLETWFRNVEKSPDSNKQLIIKRVQEYVHKNYMNDITLSQIAEVADLSVSRFCVIFKQQHHDSFVNYVNQVRIDKAKELLLETDLKIYEVADMVGFSTLPYFNRLFKSVTGQSPNEYKRSLGL
ncbi:response regulator transcription factor [Paenibacillus whitsoniae]|uniref:Response regulator n=1 Tax=Paenibacillus whitsoniae TaxID=2496558 RepID=A0A430JK90_9BACL|nr:response regulator [Paenibacillus whitsoniae]RTE11477.1 response regulator [Paenibacillus whitsoniae]